MRPNRSDKNPVRGKRRAVGKDNAVMISPPCTWVNSRLSLILGRIGIIIELLSAQINGTEISVVINIWLCFNRTTLNGFLSTIPQNR